MAKEKQSPRWIQAWIGGQSHWTHEFAEGKSFKIPYHPRNSQLDIAPKSEQQGQALAAALKKELDELFLNARSQGFSYKDAAQLIAERGYILSRHDTQRFWEQGQTLKGDLSPEQEYTLSPRQRALDPTVDTTLDITVDRGYEDPEAGVSHYSKQGELSSTDLDAARAEYYERQRLEQEARDNISKSSGELTSEEVNLLQSLPSVQPVVQEAFPPDRHERHLTREYLKDVENNLPELQAFADSMEDGVQKREAQAFILELKNAEKTKRDNSAKQLEQARSILSKRYNKQSRVAWWVGDRLLDYARALMTEGGGQVGSIDPSLLEGYQEMGLVQAIEEPKRQLQASFDRERSAFRYFERLEHQKEGGRFGAIRTGEEKVPGIVSPTYEVSTRGDKRFSALNARLKDGRTIEEAYQLDVKGYRIKGDNWKLGKGRPPLNNLTPDQSYDAYKELWATWLKENPDLAAELGGIVAGGKRLTDQFARTKINQADVLMDLLQEEPISEVTEEPSASNLKSVAIFHGIDPEVAEYGVKRVAKDIIGHTPKSDLTKMLGDWSRQVDHIFRKRFGYDQLANTGPLTFLKMAGMLAEYYGVHPRDFLLTSIPQHKQIEVRGGRRSTGFDEIQQGGRTSIIMDRLEFMESGRGKTEESYQELLELNKNAIVKIHGRQNAKGKSQFLMRVAGVNQVKKEDLEGLSERTNESLQTLEARFLSAQSVGEPLIEIRLKPFEEHLGSALSEVLAPGAAEEFLLGDDPEDLKDMEEPWDMEEPYEQTTEEMRRELLETAGRVDISTSTRKSPFFQKDLKKFQQATKLISRGSSNSSSAAYAKAAGDLANTGQYHWYDIVGISVEGSRNNRIGPDFDEIQRAIISEVTFITDNPKDRARDYNVGEREIAKFLTENLYVETSEGKWNKVSVVFRESTHRRGGDPKGDIVPAFYDKGKNEITIYRKGLRAKYEEKAWTNPKVKGVKALPLDQFKTYEEWERFVIEHEQAHVRFPQREGEGHGEYEQRINEAALERIKPHKSTDQQKAESQRALELYEDELDRRKGFPVEPRELTLEEQSEKALDFYQDFYVGEGGQFSLGDPFKDDPLPGYKHYNIFAGGHSVGKVILNKTKDKFNLLHLEIFREWQGSGLGFKWMEQVIDEAWAEGVEPVFELAHNQNVIKWAKKRGGVFSGHKRAEGPEGKMESTVESIRFPLPGKGKSKK